MLSPKKAMDQGSNGSQEMNIKYSIKEVEGISSNSIEFKDIVVIGAGVTGLSAGYHLKEDYAVYEMKSATGGLAGSYTRDGFIFDHGGVHVLRTDDSYLKGKAKAHFNKLQRELLKDNIQEKEKRAFVYFQGNYHTRPFQHNLHGASEEVINECLDGFNNRPVMVDAPDDFTKSTKKYANFKEEILNVFGSGLCKHFMFPYNRKAWCTDLTNIRSKLWISKKFGTTFDPNLFLEGIKHPNGVSKTLIRYPKKGGFGATGQALYQRIKDNVFTDSKAIHLDINNKIISFINKEGKIRKVKYNILVSTIPMPELVKIIPNCPEEVKKEAENLIFTSMFSINLGIDKPVWTNKQYIYYPEEEVSFTRVSFPVNQSEYTAPPGKTGVCVEVPYSKEVPIENEEELIERCMKDLVKVGVLQGDENIMFKDIKKVKYSYVVQDVNLSHKIKVIHSFLRKYDIYSIGRYGEWKHSGTEHAIDDGRKIAEKLHFDR